MIIGDEHIAVISAEGRLPEELAEETLLVTPAAFERLRLVGARTSAVVHGQISGRLAVLTPDLRDAVLRPDSRFFTVIDASALRPTAEEVAAEAESAELRLNRLALEYVAAASLYRATIWFGHDRNVPRPIREGRVPRPVRWRRLSELASWNA